MKTSRERAQESHIVRALVGKIEERGGVCRCKTADGWSAYRATIKVGENRVFRAYVLCIRCRRFWRSL